MTGDEAGERADLSEQSHLVHLGDHSVEDLSLEGPEDDGFVLDGVEDEPLTSLDEAGSNTVDGGDGNDEAILA